MIKKRSLKICQKEQQFIVHAQYGNLNFSDAICLTTHLQAVQCLHKGIRSGVVQLQVQSGRTHAGGCHPSFASCYC